MASHEAHDESKTQDSATAFVQTAEQTWAAWVDHVAHWLASQWGENRPCPYCTNETWVIGDVVEVHPSGAYPRNPQHALGGYFPLIQVICTRCGHTVLVNALSIRSIEPPPP